MKITITQKNILKIYRGFEVVWYLSLGTFIAVMLYFSYLWSYNLRIVSFTKSR